MDPQTIRLPTELVKIVEALGESLASSPPIAGYLEAQARLEHDERARALLDHVAAIERDVRQRQADGTLTRDDIDRVRAAQNEARSNPVIMEAQTAQQAAAVYLPQVNRSITRSLGVDIAALARTGGC